MGSESSQTGESKNEAGAAICERAFLPGAHGECLEAASEGIKLHLGCGNKNWDGWVNVDLFGKPDITSDLRKLPFEDNYADSAIAIHVLEHFYLWDVPDVLQEWKRVLKPHGKLILELPCMNKVMKYIADCINHGQDLGMQMTWLALWGDPKHKSVEMCHKWGYTKLQLTELLQDAGFYGMLIEEPRYHLKERDMRIIAYKGENS